jgi:hypothetical protein
VDKCSGPGPAPPPAPAPAPGNDSGKTYFDAVARCHATCVGDAQCASFAGERCYRVDKCTGE